MSGSWQFSKENIYLLLSILRLFNHRNLAYFEQLFILPILVFNQENNLLF